MHEWEERHTGPARIVKDWLRVCKRCGAEERREWGMRGGVVTVYSRGSLKGPAPRNVPCKRRGEP